MSDDDRKFEDKEKSSSAARNVPSKEGARYRTSSDSSDAGDSEVGDSKINSREKRKCTGSSSLTNGTFGATVPESPPTFVSLEQIMKAANGLTNMALAHEITLNGDFSLHKMEYPQNSLESKVKEILHQAFWDILREELNEDPPNYKQAMNLLSEVKETLLELLLPHHTRIATQINETLDLDLIKQQAEHGTLDFQQYAQFVISMMAQLCAPVRDAKIRELMNIKEIVPLFRSIMETLEMMRIDMANFTIQVMRPHIQQRSVTYEQEKFQEFLETQAGLALNDDPLKHTKDWLKRSYDTLNYENAKHSPDPTANLTTSGPSLSHVLAKAYMELLQWDDEVSYPETLTMDKTRFSALKDQILDATIVSSVLLVTYSTVGSALQGISEFKENLKSHVTLLLEGCAKCGESELREKLQNVAVQVIKEVQECLQKHGYLTITLSQEHILQGLIIDVVSSDHRVRKLLSTRILEFIEDAVSSSTAGPTQIPPGLSTLQTELTHITGQFLRLVSHNRAVYGQYYVDILKDLKKSTLLPLDEKSCD